MNRRVLCTQIFSLFQLMEGNAKNLYEIFGTVRQHHDILSDAEKYAVGWLTIERDILRRYKL